MQSNKEDLNSVGIRGVRQNGEVIKVNGGINVREHFEDAIKRGVPYAG